MTAFLGGPDERERALGKEAKKKMFRKLEKGRV
jgi:hypothetical protein